MSGTVGIPEVLIFLAVLTGIPVVAKPVNRTAARWST